MITIFCPQKILHDHPFFSGPPNDAKDEKFKNMCLFAVSQIMSLKGIYTTGNRGHDDVYTEIPAKEWEAMLTSHHYLKVINKLSEIGIIEICKKYSSGGYKNTPAYAKGYKISDQWKSVVVKKQIKLISGFNYITNKKLQKIESDKKSGKLSRLKVDLKERKEDTSKTIDIRFLSEEQKAECEFYDEYIFISNNMKFLGKSHDYQKIYDELISKNNNADSESIDKMNKAIISSSKLFDPNEQIFRYSKNTGRFNYRLTSLKRELRPCLTINGNPTSEVDIRSSQPYFSQVLYNEAKFDNNDFVEFLRDQFRGLVKESKKELERSFSGLDIAKELIRREQVKLNLIIQKGFYRYIYKNQKTDQQNLLDDTALKEMSYRQIFFGSKSQRKAYWEAFESEFPILAYLVDQTSQNKLIAAEFDASGKYIGTGNSQLAIKLQKEEAKIIFAVV